MLGLGHCARLERFGDNLRWMLDANHPSSALTNAGSAGAQPALSAQQMLAMAGKLDLVNNVFQNGVHGSLRNTIVEVGPLPDTCSACSAPFRSMFNMHLAVIHQSVYSCRHHVRQSHRAMSGAGPGLLDFHHRSQKVTGEDHDPWTCTFETHDDLGPCSWTRSIKQLLRARSLPLACTWTSPPMETCPPSSGHTASHRHLAWWSVMCSYGEPARSKGNPHAAAEVLQQIQVTEVILK